jgi:hypothetical protein
MGTWGYNWATLPLGGYKYRGLVLQGRVGCGVIIVEKPLRNSAGLNLRQPGKEEVNDLRIATWNVLSLYRSGAYRSYLM